MQFKRLRFIIFIILLGIIYLSCDLFDPNDPPTISEVNVEIDDHTVTVSWLGEDTNGEIAYYRIALDDSINLESVGTQSSHVYSDVENGSHTFYIIAKDDAGDESGLVKEDFAIDVLPVKIPLQFPKNDSTLTQRNITFTWEDDPEASSYQIEIGTFVEPDSIDPMIQEQTTTNQYTLTESVENDTYHWRVGAINSLGNRGPWSDIWMINIQTKGEPPAVTLTNTPEAATNELPVIFVWTGTDDWTPPNEILYSHRQDDGEWSAWSPATEFEWTPTDGQHTFAVKAVDADTNESSPATSEFIVDVTGPTVSLESQNLTSTSGTFSWSATDNLTPNELITFQHRLDGGAWTDWSIFKSVEFSGLDTQEHLFEVQARDTLGNLSDIVSQSWGSSAPVVNITDNPEALTNDVPVHFAWTGNDDETPVNDLDYSYRRDSEDWSAWDNLTELNWSPEDGEHTFEVKARDTDGNESSSPAASQFTVDTTPPDLNITVNSTSPTSASFSWTGTDVHAISYRYRIDGASWSGWGTSTSYNFTGLTGGEEHTFELEAQDAAGNTSDIASHTWGSAIPSVSFTQTPDALTNQTPVAFTWSGTDDETPANELEFRYRQDGGTWSNWTNITTLNWSPSDGTHTFAVTVRDADGNEASPISDDFTLDTTPPGLNLTVNETTPTSGSFSWSGSDNIATSGELVYQYRLDGGSWSSWSASTSQAFTGLTGGQEHTFDVRPQDNAGNIGSVVTHTWSSLAPTITFTQTPDPLVNVSPVTFAWEGDDDNTPTNQLQYSTQHDGGPWSDWIANTSQDWAPADGQHTFAVKTRDADGNESIPTSHDFTLDTRPPSVVLSVDETTPTTASFSWSGTDNLSSAGELTYQFRLDGGNWSEWVSTTAHEYTGLTAGVEYTFELQAQDAAGNVSSIVSHAWGSAIPNVRFTQTPEVLTSNATVTFTWSGSDDETPEENLEYSVQLDSGPWSAWTTNTSRNWTPGDGPHTFAVRVRDTDDNESNPLSYDFTVDTTPPGVTFTETTTTPTTASFSWSGTDNLSTSGEITYQYRLDESIWSGWTSSTSIDYTDLVGGESHTFEVRGRDAAENIGNPATNTWGSAAPTVSFTQTPDALTNVSPVTFIWTGTDDQTSSENLEYSTQLDGAAWSSWSSATSDDLTPEDGTHTFGVRARDTDGNVSDPIIDNFTLDTTSPVANLNVDATTQTSASFSWSGTDNLSGSANLNFQYQLNDGGWSAWDATTSVDFTNLSTNQVHSFELRSQDIAGNISDIVSHSWGSLAPSVSFTETPDVLTNTLPATFTWTGTDDVTPAAQLEFRYQLDGATWSAWSTAITFDWSPADGSHTFTVVARDSDGNISTSLSHNFNLDTEAPVVNLSVDATSPTSASFSWSGTDNVSASGALAFRYRIDLRAEQ